MFGAASARTAYRDVGLRSRIEGATPHRLIAILFEELDTAIETMAVAAKAGDRGRLFAGQSRALTILSGLEAGLDREAGGDLAGGLAAVYGEGRRLLREGGVATDPERIERARAMLAEIAGAWAQIG